MVEGFKQKYGGVTQPIFEGKLQLIQYLEAGLIYRVGLSEWFKNHQAPSQVMMSIQEDLHSHEKLLQRLNKKSSLQLSDAQEIPKKLQKHLAPDKPAPKSPEAPGPVQDEKQQESPFHTPDVYGSVSPFGTGRTIDTSVAQNLEDTFRDMWEDKFSGGDAFLKSFQIGSPAPSVAQTFVSHMAVHAKPLVPTHVVRLKGILNPLGTEKERHLSDFQVYGFQFNDWLTQNKDSFPIQSMRGAKITFGDYIKTNYNKRSREFTFSVSRKGNIVEVDALMHHIDNSYPKIYAARVFVKRGKKWNRIKDIHNRYDLSEYVRASLKTKTKVFMKLKW